MMMVQSFGVPVRALTARSFRPFGEVIEPREGLGQFIDKPYDPETSGVEADLVLTNGKPRLWIMHLEKVGVSFSKMARHGRVTQCLGSLGGKEWFIAVAASDSANEAGRPRLEDIQGFRISGSCVVKLGIGTWHAGPLFLHDDCLFFNLENLDTNKRDFQGVDLPLDCHLTV
jgi:ureidoglycolate hydrolase